MRQLFLLVTSCFVMSMVLAPAAVAQTVFPQSDGSGATIGDGCPAGEYGAIPPGTPGEFGFDCFGTLEEAQYYAETGELLPEDQSEPESPTLGNSRAAALDPANYDRSEINPNGPCFDPQLSGDVTGVPVGDLALAYVNRNDPAGTPTVSPLDYDNDGIACNALTQAEAQAISNGETDEDTATETQTGNSGMTNLPNTGGPALLPIAGGLFALGAGGLLLRRRLS